MKYAYYKEKINVFVALAPVAKMFNAPSAGSRAIATKIAQV